MLASARPSQRQSQTVQQTEERVHKSQTLDTETVDDRIVSSKMHELKLRGKGVEWQKVR